jgi:NAD(P)-dependent dehydrogenase (short-subunit alcohol dehydrogenase family)
MAAQLPPVALVTGASRGIGEGIARHLARRGARVAVHFNRNEAAARAVRDGLAGSGHSLHQADISRGDECGHLVGEVIQAHGRLDLLVNNAGLAEDHPISDGDLNFDTWEVIWERTIGANLLGPAHLTFHAVRHMQSRGPADGAFGKGRIVNLSSRGAFRGEPRAPAYGASKAGLNAFGQSLARALAPEGIYVYTVAPGWVDTDMAAGALHGPGANEVIAQHPLGRVATVEEISATVTWLALDAPAVMTGCIVDANGASYLRT